MSEAIKIQKVLAGLGYASRREIENWIKQGRIKLNHEVATLGQRVTIEDSLEVDGEAVKIASFFNEVDTKVLLYNKPLGQECSKKPSDDRQSVFEAFPDNERWILVGRLDVNTSGLLLVTNNGELANRLMHPSYGITREYRVRVDGHLSAEQLAQATQGVEVDGFVAKFDKIEPLQKVGHRNQWYRVELQTGRNKEVRRLFNAVGVKVNRLLRTKFANVLLPRSVPPGQCKLLSKDEVATLIKLVKMG